jgi:hypothetical protein
MSNAGIGSVRRSTRTEWGRPPGRISRCERPGGILNFYWRRAG